LAAGLRVGGASGPRIAHLSRGSEPLVATSSRKGAFAGPYSCATPERGRVSNVRSAPQVLPAPEIVPNAKEARAR